MLTDVAYNWRKAKLMGRNHPPPLQALQAGTTLSAHNSVFLPWGSWGDDVMVIRDWMAENGKAGQATARIYGRFEWSQRRFNLACKLVGLAFEFTDMTDLLYFKLRGYH